MLSLLNVLLGFKKWDIWVIAYNKGVKVDPNKIKTIMEWSIPKNLKNLRGLLGLTGYYHKFTKNYGKIIVPLTMLLKKNAFYWTQEATLFNYS